MSIATKVMETIARLKSDAPQDPLLHEKRAVGRPMRRVDGKLKVTGTATFSAEFPFERLAHAALVTSTIARGRIAKIDTSKAEAAPGVVVVMTHANAPRMAPPLLESEGGSGASKLPVMQDDQVHWNGQPVAVVVADSEEEARAAAGLVEVEYLPGEALLSFDAAKGAAAPPKQIMGQPPFVKHGDAAAALAEAATKVDCIYRTPFSHHNALELHTTIAEWEGDDVTVFDASQSIAASRDTLAKMFGMDPKQVRVLSPYVGGGFGGKGMMTQSTILAVAVAKLAKRPVRLVLTREETFRIVGGRTVSEQRVALGVGEDRKLTAVIHTGATAVVAHNDFPEQFSFPARHLYATETYEIGQKAIALDMVANSAMRAPGESIGTFALESAVDELAHALGMDPVAFRRLNEPEKDPTKGTPFSHRALLLAYERGAAKFGWDPARPRAPRQDGEWLVGQGVATAYYPYMRWPARVRVRLVADGTAIVQTSAHEMGMGTATAQAQHAADRLGLAVDRVTFEYGDSTLPDGPLAGGSGQTASLVAAVTVASEKLNAELLRLAPKGSPLHGVKDVVARNGGLYCRDDAARGESYDVLLRRAGKDFLELEADAPPFLEAMKYSMASYGAQFCEVRVSSITGEVRVSRWVGSFDAGRILNPRTATSQFRGGIIMGIGMALMEGSDLDERSGRFATASLADYHVPVHLDVPPIDVLFNDIPDPHAPMGVHGIGEIGITGCAAAIANAIFDATGKRVRSLPIRLDALL